MYQILSNFLDLTFINDDDYADDSSIIHFIFDLIFTDSACPAKCRPDYPCEDKRQQDRSAGAGLARDLRNAALPGKHLPESCE